MSWMLFLDESGHDHKGAPYEVRGGFAIHTSKVWALITGIRTLEQSTFGCPLSEHGIEIKGAKLLGTNRFKWAAQAPRLEDAARRRHCVAFLNETRQKKQPTRAGFTAYGQACTQFVEDALLTMRSHDCRVFASIIPRVKRPEDNTYAEFLRKDQVFLFERYFYFLDGAKEHGLIVMDGSDKSADRKFVRRMERYFLETRIGKQRTQWIVPVPLFVESDMAYGVQLADLCIYCLNWGHRLRGMSEPVRTEVQDFAWLIEKMIWHGDGHRDGTVFKTHGTVFVPDPFESR